ncbi:hypothetical protein NITHO_4000003 [Nitrolancea hollandica Lb]|uniref:Uncharacterized protein n=1 Tax=Nitrolancea hollandica Lb TaxID=1129897 RepID=I4EJF9_9BACT|nr:hypothetical protein NITHO_4000003 [Nitrolancea hollandica Lb]
MIRVSIEHVEQQEATDRVALPGPVSHAGRDETAGRWPSIRQVCRPGAPVIGVPDPLN